MPDAFPADRLSYAGRHRTDNPLSPMVLPGNCTTIFPGKQFLFSFFLVCFSVVQRPGWSFFIFS